MSFNPQEQEKREYDLIEEGTYGARVARIVELGVQKDKYGEKPKVMIGFTIPSEKIEIDGEEKQRFMWHTWFGLNQTSNPDSTLMKTINGIDGSVTHLSQLLNKPCMISIKHSDPKPDGSQFANISSVSKPMKGLDIEEPDIDVYMYEFENGEDEVFEQLGEKIQERIKAAVNW